MILPRSIRIVKKICEGGRWRWTTLARKGNRYVWDDRPGGYFLDWYEGKRRRRQFAGNTPAEALNAHRLKCLESFTPNRPDIQAAKATAEFLPPGVPVSQATDLPLTPPHPQTEPESVVACGRTAIVGAEKLFIAYIGTHSPDKPETVRRYRQVMVLFKRHLGHKGFVEAIQRSDIDDYKIARLREFNERTGRPITPRTVNFEVGTLRTFFYYLIGERGVQMKNPCKKFKRLRDAKAKAKRRPPTYSEQELQALFARCDAFEKAVFATLLLTGLRKRELYFLAWPDVDLRTPRLKVSGEGKEGFSPKDYEERDIPLPPDLVEIFKNLPRTSRWVFANRNGNQLNHLLRRLKSIAARAGVANATLHKFRHTYATRLLQEGADIVTVQKLMGHSDIETTRQYLNPEDDLKRKAASRLSLPSDLASKGSMAG